MDPFAGSESHAGAEIVMIRGNDRLTICGVIASILIYFSSLGDSVESLGQYDIFEWLRGIF